MSARTAEPMTILLTCARAIQPHLRKEVEALGYDVVYEHPAAIEIVGTFADCMRLNLWIRTAHRVLLRLGSWSVNDANAMYEVVKTVAWEDIIDADGYVAVVSSVKTGSIDNTQYANVRCKDAIVDRIREKKGRRPDSGAATDRAVVFLFWHDETCMVYLDTSGTPLSERGYRIHPGKAPLRESLAAAVVMALDWKSGQPFVNPMCGSGTLGIEAAMVQANLAPGSIRTNFSFMHTLWYDANAWNIMRDEARAGRKTVERDQFICTDYDKVVLEFARENARRAGVAAFMRFSQCEFRQTPLPEPPGIIIFNPEYGLRMGNEERLRTTYHDIGDFLKTECKGYFGYVFTGNMDLAKEIGLKTKRRIEFWSADIECRLLEFELYEGSKKGLKRDVPQG